MPDRSVICNTSPLLYLHQVGRIELLQRLYGQILVPPAVARELRDGHERGVSVPTISAMDWVVIRNPEAGSPAPIVVDLGPGEAEVIALGLQMPGSLLVLDDQLGRRIARLNGLLVTGTLGVLIRAKQEGLLAEIRPTLMQLLQTSLWLSEALVRSALSAAGETDESV